MAEGQHNSIMEEFLVPESQKWEAKIYLQEAAQAQCITSFEQFDLVEEKLVFSSGGLEDFPECRRDSFLVSSRQDNLQEFRAEHERVYTRVTQGLHRAGSMAFFSKAVRYQDCLDRG